MATTIKLRTSVVKDKTPTAASIEIGEVCVGAHPDSPMLLFKDSSDNIIKIEPGSGVVPSPTPPEGPNPGDIWFDENTNSLKYWNGSAWIELGQAGDSPVTSVNGEVGVVVLDAADVGALAPGDDVSSLVNDAGYLTSTTLPELIDDGSLELPFVPLGSWAAIPALPTVRNRPLLEKING